ncbi:MAG TPA: hypothetical protein VD706_00735 [Candidatus Saccharimonadales bacterium]|nr:hypothetical protein [Candidatus Saccharimonadales bacterium]
MNPTNEAGQGGSGSVPVNPGGQNVPGQIPVQQPSQFPPMPPMTPPSVPQQTGPAMPPADMPQNPIKTDVQATTQMATPQVIDDGDLIEKEWVHKAKQIVDQNRDNPHKQSEELTVFRADYMKKRYNKNIKVDK